MWNYCIMHQMNGRPQRRESKAFSDVAGHILHSFCAGDHGPKGIPGTSVFSFLINSFLTDHSIPCHTVSKKNNLFLLFFFNK